MITSTPVAHKHSDGKTSRGTNNDNTSELDIDEQLDVVLESATIGRRGCRKRLHHILISRYWEGIIAVLIGLNFVAIAVETDILANDPDDQRSWMKVINTVFLSLFVIELCLRLFTYQGLFLTSGWNVLDSVIIVADAVSTFLLPAVPGGSSLSSLRIISLLRLLRSVKILQLAPQLALMVRGLIATIEVLLWGCIMLLMSMVIFSVFAVQLIHPINLRLAESGIYDGCERCPRAFSSVSSAFLTFVQQIVTGDSWGLITIPIIEESPWTAVFFGFIFITVHLLLMNVILSVIVDTAQRVSQEDTKELLKTKEKEFTAQSDSLKRLCALMDEDGSGTLTKEEIYQGYDNNEEFRNCLSLMDIKREELDAVFSILDSDGSGTLAYDEFVEELYRMRTQAAHTLLVFIKFNVSQVKVMVEDVRSMITNYSASSKEELGTLGSTFKDSADQILASTGSVGSLKAQLRQELNEMETKAHSQTDQLLEQLRELVSGHPASQWRSDLSQVLHQRASGTAGEKQRLPLAQSAAMAPLGGDQRGSGAFERPPANDRKSWPPSNEDNVMPCCRVGKGGTEPDRIAPPMPPR